MLPSDESYVRISVKDLLARIDQKLDDLNDKVEAGLGNLSSRLAAIEARVPLYDRTAAAAEQIGRDVSDLQGTAKAVEKLDNHSRWLVGLTVSVVLAAAAGGLNLALKLMGL